MHGHHTEEAKRKISEAHKGKPSILKGKTFDEIYGKEKAAMLRKQHSEAIKAWIKRAGHPRGTLGKPVSEETRNKISVANKGMMAWNLGIPMWKDKQHPMQGKHHTIESRTKIGRGVSGDRNGFFGKHHTEENKRTMSEKRQILCKHNILGISKCALCKKELNRKWRLENKAAQSEYRRNYRNMPAHKEEARIRNRIWRAKNKEHRRLYWIEFRRNTQQKLKKRIFNALGDKCIKCGFTDIRALQIDHKKGGGNKAWLSYRGNRLKYLKNVLNNITEFQLLCANCNWIKRDENNEVLRPRVFHKPKRLPYKEF